MLSNDTLLDLLGDGTDNLCLWEVRAVNADNAATLAGQQPPDANVYPPPPPKDLAYSLAVPLHEGINTIDVIAEDCAGWEDSVRVQVVRVTPGPHDPRSKGFWSNAVKTRHYTGADMQKFINYTNVASDVWGNDASRNRYGPLSLANIFTILGVPDNAAMEPKMKGQLMADWLNMVSGRLAIKKAVNVTKIGGWPLVMDDIGGNPVTFAYKVTLEIEEKAQPAPPTFAQAAVSKNLAEALDVGSIYLP
jgi:hypothetical protein